jgi:hypothetical protein
MVSVIILTITILTNIMLSVVMLSVTSLSDSMLSVFKRGVVMLIHNMLNVVMLSGTALVIQLRTRLRVVLVHYNCKYLFKVFKMVRFLSIGLPIWWNKESRILKDKNLINKSSEIF